MIEVGSVCIKTSGREKGKYAVVVQVIDKNFVLVTGPKKLTGVKRRKANVRHLKETGEKLQIKEKASDEEVLKAWKSSGLIKKYKLKEPTTVKEKTESKKTKGKKENKKQKKKK